MRDITGRIDALSELINDLMVFSRPRPLSVGPVELRAVANDAMSVVHRDPSAQRVTIEVTGGPVYLRADSDMLRAAVLNLLLNAAQAMGGEGRIAVAVAARDGGGVITIRDTGPGIPPDVMPKVFEPFFTTKARGGGLGLPIARRTAERHGGTLELTCPAGGGTLATLVLPADRGLKADAAAG
jgi:signal transduction histidine kinase